MKPYRFAKAADVEFQEFIRYYDEQVAGLGDKFIADVESTIRTICEYPASGRRVSRIVRKRILRVFKHNVLYIDEATDIVIIAIAPHKRRPGYWRKRLRDLTR